VADVAMRSMAPSDGPAIDALMRSEAQTTRVSLSTHYLHDVYEALLAQHPTLFGVVVEKAGGDGLVGMATAFTDEVGVGGATLPSAQLENLKVRHDVRRQGLGSRLASWRIDEARRRFGRDGVIVAGVEASNAASLATAARWASQVLGPLRIVIGQTTPKRPTQSDLEVRPATDRDIEAIVESTNRYYAEHLLFPVFTASRLEASLGPTALGEPIRQYRVAVARDGTIVAGAELVERFKIMVDHIEQMPWPIAMLGRLSGQLPADRIIRSVELGGVWHADGQSAAVGHLWDAIRHEWRERATNVVAVNDPRGSLIDQFRVGRSFAPRIELMVPVSSPVRLDERRLVYIGR
jgi:predicted N-acetyltransferase YhbS